MLGVSIGIRNQQHVLIDFITGLLPGKLRVWIFSLVQLIIFSAILLLFYYGITVFNKASDQLVSLGISDKWLYLSLPVGAVLMLFRFLQAQQENYHKGDSLIPVWVYLVLTVTVLLVAFIEPAWFKALRISEYVKFGKNAVYVALVIWLIIMFAGVPVGWSLFIAAVLFFSMTRWGTGNFAAAKLVDSVNSFGLLSVPFFILTGILMNSAGITTRIFNFALAMLGHYTGGMGHVNIAASLIFSGMSGSALADAGGLGQLEIKAMRDDGYEDDLCGGITAASCIIGGIFSGAFTPTEAAVIAALYSIILGMFIYRELTPAGLFTCCVEAMAITGVTVLMVMTVTFFGDMIARERVALQFLVLPMLIPIAQQFNIDLVFFGVMTTLNMMIGILTPPMGMALFVVARVGNMSVSTVTRGVIPFIIPIALCLLLITLFPSIVTFLPNLIMG